MIHLSTEINCFIRKIMDDSYSKKPIDHIIRNVYIVSIRLFTINLALNIYTVGNHIHFSTIHLFSMQLS